MEKTFFQKYKIWFFVIGFMLLIAFGSTLFNGVRKTITLNVWGVNFTDEQFDILSKNIKQTSKNRIKFVYTEKTIASYEKDLLDSFIHSESPDIFLINNEQLGKFKKLISPISLEDKGYNINNLKKDFPTIIADEAVLKNQLYMIPVSIDSLALYYNQNVFDSLSIPNPPTTWASVLQLIPTLRQLDSYNRISRSPIGMGDGKTITNSSSLLSLLMMQIGSKIINTSEQRVVLTERTKVNDEYVSPGTEALAFYCQFSQPNNQSYSWNSSFINDLDAFANNKLAMYIGYFSDRDTIIDKNPNLIFDVSEMPQRSGSDNVNFGRFWGLTVSSQSKNKTVAWEALQLLTAPTNLKTLIDFSKFPPANRALINEYYNDSDISVFAKQALSSKSFYNPDHQRVREFFLEAINSGNLNKDYRTSIDRLNQDLTNLMYNN